MKLSAILLDVRVYRRSDIGSDHSLTSAKLRFPSKCLRLPKNTAGKNSILHYKSILLNNSMAIQTNNSTETTRNARNQQYCFGMGNIKTIISQAADDSLWKYEAFTKKKIKSMGWWNKIILQQNNNLACKTIFQKRPYEKRLNINVEEPLLKENTEKDIENPEKNLYHTYDLPYIK